MSRVAFVFCAALCVLAIPAAAQNPDTALIDQALNAGSDGDAPRARQLAGKAAAACRKTKDETVCLLSTHVLLSRNFSRRTLYTLALEQARAAATVAKTSTQEAQLSVLLMLAGAAARAGELEEAEAAIAEGRGIANAFAEELPPERAHQIKLAAGMFGGPQALVYSARGEHVRAVASQQTLVKAIRSNNPDHPNLSIELAALGQLQEDAADPAGARQSYAEAVALAQRHRNSHVRDKARAALVRLDAAAAK
jgi:tetratricopeptide (TPR) repeat protein